MYEGMNYLHGLWEFNFNLYPDFDGDECITIRKNIDERFVIHYGIDKIEQLINYISNKEKNEILMITWSLGACRPITPASEIEM